MKRLAQLSALLMAWLFAGLVQAVPITYTLNGTVSGQLAGEAFDGAAFSLTGVGEGDALEQPEEGVSIVPLQFLTIELDGFGTLEAVNATSFFLNRNLSLAGFLDFFDGDIIDLSAAAFADHDGVTDLGPLPVTADYLGQFDTSGGTLRFTDSAGLVWQVIGEDDIPVPEPASAALLAAGLLILGAARRHRRGPLALA